MNACVDLIHVHGTHMAYALHSDGQDVTCILCSIVYPGTVLS